MNGSWWIGVFAFVGVLAAIGLSHVTVAHLSRRADAGRLYWAVLIFGLALTLSTLLVRDPGWQAVLGLLGGVALWSAVGELGEAAGVGQRIAPGNWSVMLVVWLFLIFGVGAPFPPVTGFRALVGLPSDLPVADRAWGVITAGQFFLLTWLGHVTLLTAYYHPWFGVRSPLTWGLLGASLAGIGFLPPQVAHQTALGPAIRWAIWAVIVFWTAIEILRKWGLFSRRRGETA